MQERQPAELAQYATAVDAATEGAPAQSCPAPTDAERADGAPGHDGHAFCFAGHRYDRPRRGDTRGTRTRRTAIEVHLSPMS
jgi:hypothetical protein